MRTNKPDNGQHQHHSSRAVLQEDCVSNNYKNIPTKFLCPITGCLMENPLVSRYGQSFEHEAIVNWLGMGNDTCPLTRQPLRISHLISNHGLRREIEEWKKKSSSGPAGLDTTSLSSIGMTASPPPLDDNDSPFSLSRKGSCSIPKFFMSFHDKKVGVYK